MRLANKILMGLLAKKIIPLIITVFVIKIIPQSSLVETVTITSPAGYTLGLLNEHGTSGISTNVSNITFINPAAINQFDVFSFGFSYQFNSKIDEAWYADIGISRVNNFTPQSVGIVAPYNNMRFGIGMGQIYNAALEIGEIAVTTTVNPGGTGETYTPVFETTVQNYSFLFAYNFKNLFSTNHELTTGIKLNLNRLSQFESMPFIDDLSESVIKESWAAGAIYKIAFDENKSIHFGLAFENEVLFSKSIEYKISDTTNFGVTGINRPPFLKIDDVNFIMTGKVPGKLTFDTYISISQQLKILTNLTNVFWNSISDVHQNQLEFSGSVVYSFNNNITSSFGAYYTNRIRNDYINDMRGVEDKLNAFFLTAGINVRYGFLSVGLAIADSHLASSDLRKQTVLKMIVAVNVN
jgi:hypothetical protein